MQKIYGYTQTYPVVKNSVGMDHYRPVQSPFYDSISIQLVFNVHIQSKLL